MVTGSVQSYCTHWSVTWGQMPQTFALSLGVTSPDDVGWTLSLRPVTLFHPAVPDAVGAASRATLRWCEPSAFGTARSTTGETLPALSVERTCTLVSSSPTSTEPVSAVQSPESPRRYSIDATPDPASVADALTVRETASAVTSTAGAAVSMRTVCSVTGEVLPAASVARACTTWDPSPVTETVPV